VEPVELALLGIVFGAFLVGSTLGFASSVLAVTFGAQLIALDALLPVLAPLNIAVSSYLAIRYRRETAWPMLFRRILPLVGAGIPMGLLLFNLEEMRALRLAFGLFVILLASLQLWLSRRSGAPVPLPRALGGGLLVGGGLAHGLFGSGGPLIVYVIGREIGDKGSFRSTLATMWIPMNAALVVNYLMRDLYDAEVMKLSAAALLPVILATVIGERVHARLDAERFRTAVWLLLLVGGVILSVRAASDLLG
jgi:uncharacterized protein